MTGPGTVTVHALTWDLTAGQILTANQRHHWTRRSRLTKALRSRAYWNARHHDIPALGQVRITATVAWPDRRRRDVHNLMPTFKALVDGLVDAGVIPDDDDKHLTGPDPRAVPEPLPRDLWVNPFTQTTRVTFWIAPLTEGDPA